MEPSNQQVFVSEPYVVVTSAVPTIQNPSNEKLPGYRGRCITGGIQIICGLLEIAFGIAVIIIPLRYYTATFLYARDGKPEDADGDNVGWGIWNGTFAVLTGVLGCCSRRSKSTAVAYVVTSLLAVVPSSICFLWGVLHISRANRALPDYDRVVNLAMYRILSIAFAVQIVTSISEACFGCCASRPTKSPHQVVHSTSPMPLQQAGPLPHFNNPPTLSQALAPPPPYNPSLPSFGT
ncbi:hypothetical protein HOLleu_19513 [Holothuria leucospilota]|uniref:Uncharacterized protein n=1 Tax=Holothuria leucospilota TaxID=206669 RepID=A0A9Q1H516_HOLLE|nr:hypothetical protein HOLleu_19513 [Holothuria leucospilota]